MKRSVLFSTLLLVALMLSACSPFSAITSLAGSAFSQEAQPLSNTTGRDASKSVVQLNDTSPQVIETSTLEQIYQNVNPSVVNITVVSQVSAGSIDQNFERFPFNDLPQGNAPSALSTSLGSGFVWDKAGHIVTNNHVVKNGGEISVMFSDGFVVPAEIVATDSYSDLAVLKVDMPADSLTPVTLASSADVRVGQTAVAIGNPYGLEGTMTLGIISAVGRSLTVDAESSTGLSSGSSYTIPNVIQTDAPINPGNSGGVLLNVEGQVVGVTSAIESSTDSNAGIGFAVPSDIVARVVPALIDNGKYEYPYLGISGTSLSYALNQAMNLDENQRGVLVAQVTDGGPADTAGVQGSDRQVEVDGTSVTVGGDIITQIDGQPVTTFDGMVAYLIENKSPGDTAVLQVLRDGKTVKVTLTLGTRPVQ